MRRKCVLMHKVSRGQSSDDGCEHNLVAGHPITQARELDRRNRPGGSHGSTRSCRRATSHTPGDTGVIQCALIGFCWWGAQPSSGCIWCAQWSANYTESHLRFKVYTFASFFTLDVLLLGVHFPYSCPCVCNSYCNGRYSAHQTLACG